MLACSVNTTQLPVAEESTPVDTTFKVSGKLVTIHSDPKVGELGIVVLSAGGQAQQFFATDAASASRIADVVKKFLDVNKNQIQIGTVFAVTPLTGTNFVSVVVQMQEQREQPPYYVHIFGQYPFADLDVVDAVKTHIHKGVVDDAELTQHT